MKLKILAINLHLTTRNIKSTSFYQAPSFSDHDVLVIDPEHISNRWNHIEPEPNGSLWSYSEYDRGFSKALSTTMKRRGEEAMLLLEKTKGIIVCFLRRKGPILNWKSFPSTRGYGGEISCYGWLPSRKYTYPDIIRYQPNGKRREAWRTYTFSFSSFNPVHRTGREIGEINKAHPFSQYFGLKDKIYFEAVINDDELLRVAKPIAKNKVGEVIALELPFGEGKIIFLPPIVESADRKKVSGVLVDCIRKAAHWTQPLTQPEWLAKYELPGEPENQKKIKALQSEIASLEKEKQKTEERKNKLEMLKGILYEQGRFGLEPPVREAFHILGFQVLDPEDYNEDYDLYIKENGLEIIGEIQGSTNQVDVWKYRQLLDYVNTEVEKGKNVKGLLIGNGLTDMAPDKRIEQFTEKAILGCKKQKFCRMTTHELFKAVRTVLSEPRNKKLKKSIKQEILQCNDEFKFD